MKLEYENHLHCSTVRSQVILWVTKSSDYGVEANRPTYCISWGNIEQIAVKKNISVIVPPTMLHEAFLQTNDLPRSSFDFKSILAVAVQVGGDGIIITEGRNARPFVMLAR